MSEPILNSLVTARTVDVANVVVPTFTVRRSMVDEELAMMPRVEVGVSAPDTIFQSLKFGPIKSTPSIAPITPPVELVLSIFEVRYERARETVEVAFVVVLLFIVRPLIVEEAACTVIPIVVVGVREPPETCQSLKRVPI